MSPEPAPPMAAPVQHQARPTNSMATAAFILALVGIITFIPAIIGLILGIVAKNQIKQTGEAGGGMATAAIVIGAIALAIPIIVVLAATIFVIVSDLSAATAWQTFIYIQHT